MLIAIWLAVAPLLMMTETSWLASAPAAKAPKAPSTPKASSAAPAPKASSERWTPLTVDEAWATKVLADPTYDRGWMIRCEEDDDYEYACEVRELEYEPGDRPVAIRAGDNGGMGVIGSDRKDSRVIYRARARANTEEEARELLKEIRLEVANGVLRSRGPSSTSERSWCVEVKAWVPRSSDVSLSTKNGPIAIRQVTGTMDIHSVNGPVSLIDLGGAVMARLQNGPLVVELGGSKWSGAGLDAESQNGPVNLRLPKSYSARLETGTINGPIDIEYPLEIEGRLRGHFTTTIGSGGPMVRVVTDNGPYHVSPR